MENCALYAVGTAGDALCAEGLEVVVEVAEVVVEVAEVVVEVAEVVPKVLGGYFEGGGGCAEATWRLWLAIVAKVVPKVVEFVPKVLGDCAEGGWRLCRRWRRLC